MEVPGVVLGVVTGALVLLLYLVVRPNWFGVLAGLVLGSAVYVGMTKLAIEERPDWG